MESSQSTSARMSKTGTPTAELPDYHWVFHKADEEEDTRTKWEKIHTFIYDTKTGAICGRTLTKWFQLMFFYLGLYTLLAGLCAVCMMGLMRSLDSKRPTYQLRDSLIGADPGVSFRPRSPLMKRGYSLIWFKASDNTTVDPYVQSIESLLEVYREPSKTKGVRQVCDYDQPPAPGKVCDVNVDRDIWGQCKSEESFGFTSSTPCVFIKLNRVYGWQPEFYNDTNDLPSDMPEHLKDYIMSVSNDTAKLNTVWVSCEGIGPYANESIGPLSYYPQPGFPGYFYPYENQDGYLSPLIAVHFKNPTLHSLIDLKCRIWTKNLIYKWYVSDREGFTRFQIIID